MRTLVTFSLAVFAALAISMTAFAQPQDRVTFGGDAVVRSGEVVHDVVTMGGDAVIEGEVTGDVVTMGGDLTVRNGGSVAGDLVTMGGEILIDKDAETGGEVVTAPIDMEFDADAGGGLLDDFIGWVSDVVSSFVSYTLLFVLGLVLMGAARERLDGLQLAVIKQPLRSAAMGIVGFLGAIAAIVVLCITIIGIPVAVVVGVGLPIAMYIGMAAVASIIGTVLPIAAIKDKPVMQLAAGCGALFLVSMLPFVGGAVVAVAAMLGLGAIVITRFKKAAQLDPENLGPYRTPAA